MRNFALAFAVAVLAVLPSTAAFDIYFMRHGQTDWNREHRLQGSVSHTTLTDQGRRDAESAGIGMADAGLHFDRIYTSPYSRAKETAELVARATGPAPVVDSRIREMCFGRYEGMYYGDGRYPDDNLRCFFEGNAEDYRPQGEGAESFAHVQARLRDFLENELKPLDGRVTNVLCVAHSLVLKSLVRELAGDQATAAARKALQPNCCVHVIRYENGKFSLVETGKVYRGRPMDLEIGWAERDITPELGGKKVGLAGQYYVREATNVHSRLKFTCCVMRQGDEQVLMGSLDSVSGWDPFAAKVAERLHERIPEIRPESVFISCPHIHSAPYLRPCYTEKATAWTKKNPGFLTPDEYADFVLERAVDAFAEAWRNARPGSVARAFGSARLGHCRIALYRDGTSEMYGDTRRDDFGGMLEGEDDGVEMLFTCDASGKKTGVFINAACPSQVMEQNRVISSDFSGATREKLAWEYGEGFHTIYQLGAAGDQSPRDLTRSEENGRANGWNAETVDVLSDRLTACVKAAAAEAKPGPSVLSHRVRQMRLPIRRVTESEVAVAKAELARLEARWPGTSAWDDYLREVRHFEQTGTRLPFDSKLHPYAVMDAARAVLAREKLQDAEPLLDVTTHLVRIGDVVFVSNPFELYLAFGQVIKARSAAKQTFLIGKCGSSGYVPTEKSEKVGGYSGGVNVGRIGHEGGFRFCDEVVEGIREQFK